MVEHLALIGATGSGKSDLAMHVARELGNVEIVAVDAMQIYCGMDIGTAKPSAADRAEVVHHCLDLLDPGATYSAAQFQTAARNAIAGIEARGNRALLVAGTGLYLRAVIDDLRFPGEDLDRRAELEAQTSTPEGLAQAYEQLQQLDPLAAARIDSVNQRRIVRALEVIDATGELFSSFGPGVDAYGQPVVSIRMLGIQLDRATLYSRIDQRVARMRASGFLDEVQALASNPLSRTARIAIGYAELLAYLDGTQPSLDDAFTRTAQRTRHYARRQLAWYRRDPRIHWLDAGDNPDSVAAELLAHCGATRSEV